jgi:HK97 family phage portal protein
LNLLDKIFGRKSVSMDDARFYEMLRSAIGGFGGFVKSGQVVNVDTALQVSVVMACVRVIAEGVAQVPFRLMSESKDGRTRLPAKSHSLYKVLNKKPNRWQTSFEFRETMIINAVLLGNAYAFINRVGSDEKIAELIFLPTNKVRVEILDDGSFLYQVTGRDNTQRTLTSKYIWHLRGPSLDGLIGMNVLNLARESVGLCMAAEESQADLHKNGVKSTGFYSIDGKLNSEQYKALSKWVVEQASDSSSPMILDNGAKWQTRAMTGVDAQHLETRKHQIEEVCRHFRVMPIMAGQSDKAATYASAEQMFIAHLVHTLTPWYERFEQSADCQLLTDKEIEEGYYTFLDPVGMLRGALKDTAEYLYKLVSIGSMTRNESREKLDLNPIDGLDEPLTPMNLTGSTEQGVSNG